MPVLPPGQRLPEQILALLVDRLGVPEPVARAAERVVHASGPAARQLRDHLREHPAPLSSTDSAVPRPVVHLAHALHDLGVDVVVRPACAGCGRPRPDLDYLTTGGRICGTCRSRRARVV